jgi:hypothetical protein
MAKQEIKSPSLYKSTFWEEERTEEKGKPLSSSKNRSYKTSEEIKTVSTTKALILSGLWFLGVHCGVNYIANNQLIPDYQNNVPKKVENHNENPNKKQETLHQYENHELLSHNLNVISENNIGLNNIVYKKPIERALDYSKYGLIKIEELETLRRSVEHDINDTLLERVKPNIEILIQN